MNAPTELKPRRLLLLRHAKSSWSQPGTADFDRPLNDRGRSAAVQMGNKLRSEAVSVDLIFASTAQRVCETLDGLLPAWGWVGSVIWEKQLYLATPERLMTQLTALDADWSTVMVVGHNPGLSELAMHLAKTSFDMPTAAIVTLESPLMDWPAALRSGKWEVANYWKPKVLA